MNRILERQLKRFIGEATLDSMPLPWQELLTAISDTYTHSDDDRSLILRSIDIASKEFVELNKKLKSENEIIEQKVQDRTQELDYERTKLNEIAEHMATGAILLDSKGVVTFANTAAKKMLKTSDEPTIVRTLDERFPAFAIMERVKQSLDGHSSLIPEVEMDELILSVSFGSLTNESRVFGALIWLNDITAQKMLERAKDQFLAIASHEMRTPLAIIRGSAELLLGNEHVHADPEFKERVEVVEKNAVRLLDIVNDFLDVQNIDQGNIPLKIQPVDVSKILEETCNDLAHLAQEKNLFLKLTPPASPISTIHVDPYRLQQIFINLISNAVHNTQKGGITASVVDEGGFVRVLIEDTGIGISTKDQTRLFKKFETSNTFLHSREYGSGLGLYISNLLAQRMGGELKLEKSEMGVGSTFGVSFPLTPVAPAASA